MRTVTVVTAGKGGVGKSTVSVGLATQLAQKGDRVLLIDCDAGLGNLDIILDITENLVFDISDVVKGNCKMSDSIYKAPHVQNLFLMPAPQRIADELNPYIMKRIVDVLSSYYAHIIIDCPAGIGTGFELAVAAADRALVVTNTNTVSITDSRKVRDILIDSGMEEVRMVINRFSNKYLKKSRLYEDLDVVIDEAGMQLIAVIPEDQTLITNYSLGLPLDRKSSALAAFERLSKRYVGEKVPLPPCRKI